MNITAITRCRSCGNNALRDVVNFGEHYLASIFVKDNDEAALAKKIPLIAVLCDRARTPAACGLLQLRHTVERDYFYQNYFYRSGTTTTMRNALKNVVDDFQNKIALHPGDAVLDVGCNDGTLLGYFPPFLRRVGIDPATTVDWTHSDPSLVLKRDYFSTSVAREANDGSPYRAITCIATLYDLDDPNAFVSGLKNVLAPDGVLCVQVASLAAMVEDMNVGDICHQHLCYYSLATLRALLTRHGLLIFDASVNSVNGGSIRLYATHADRPRPTAPQYTQLLAQEQELKLDDPAIYTALESKIASLAASVRTFVEQECARGGLVIGLSASVKGNTLLQLFGLNSRLISALSERSTDKIGLRTLGTDIPIVSEEGARALKPSAMLALVSFYKDEIISREQSYLAAGGKILFPIPTPTLVTSAGEHPLV